MVSASLASVLVFLALARGLPGHHAAELVLGDALREQRSPAEVKKLGLELIDRHPADWVLSKFDGGDERVRERCAGGGEAVGLGGHGRQTV